MLHDREITVNPGVLRRLGGALGIERGEGEPFLLMFGQAFFLGAMMITVYTATNTLFLAEYGAVAFPYVYLISALAIIAAGISFARLERGLPFAALLLTTNLFMLAATLFLWAGLTFGHTRWLVFAAMVWMRLLWVISNMALWALLGRLFNVRQGKRLFSLVMGGSVLAYIIFGLLMPLLIRALGIEGLILLSGLSIALSTWLQRKTLTVYRAVVAAPAERQPALQDGPSQRGFSQLLRERYVLIFFAFTALSTVATYVLDFGYLTGAAAHFTDSARLGSFFGNFAAVSMLFLLLITLLSGRLFDRYGLAAGLLLNPILVGIGTLIVVTTGAIAGTPGVFFWLVAGTKLVDDITVTINGTGRNLLYQPLPAGRQVQVQSAVESMIQPAFVGVVGAILLAFQALGDFKTINIFYLLLISIAGWLLAGVWLNREYVEQLKRAVARRRLGRKSEDISLDATGVNLLREQLESPRAGVVIYAMDTLCARQPDHLIPSLPRLLDHPVPEVRSHALSKIETHRLVSATPAVRQRFAKEEDRATKGAIIRTLAALGEIEPVAAVLAGDGDELQQEAVSALMLHGDFEAMLQALQKLLALSTSSSAVDRALAAGIVGAIGASSFYGPLQRLLADPDLSVRLSALRAAGAIRSAALWPLVLDLLADDSLRATAASALAKGGNGVLPYVAEVLPESAEPALLAQLVRVLGRLGSHGAAAILLDSLDWSPPFLRGHISAALSQCGYRAKGQEVDRIWSKIDDEIARATWLLSVSEGLHAQDLDPAGTDLLRLALGHELAGTRVTLLLLLSFLYDPQLLRDIREILSRPEANERERADALEALDNLLPQTVKRRILPLLAGRTPAEQLEQLQAAASLPIATLHLGDLLAPSPVGENPWLIACALHLAGYSRLGNLVQLVEAHLRGRDPLVQKTAQWALMRLGEADETPRVRVSEKERDLSTIEKVLYLKALELFEHIPGENLVAVADVSREVSFLAGETLVKQGELSDRLYFILEGEAQITVEDGLEVARIGPDSVLGEMSILSGGRRTASAVALTDIAALTIDRNSFRELMHENPELSQGIIKVLVRRLEEANRKLAHAIPGTTM